MNSGKIVQNSPICHVQRKAKSRSSSRALHVERRVANMFVDIARLQVIAALDANSKIGTMEAMAKHVVQ